MKIHRFVLLIVVTTVLLATLPGASLSVEGEPSIRASYDGTHCSITIVSGDASQARLDELGAEFDDYIYPTNVGALDSNDAVPNKINIVMETKDGPLGASGYFMHSQPSTVHLDIDEESYSAILSHEFTHLIHYWQVQYQWAPMPTWWKELIAEMGMYIAYGHESGAFKNHLQSYQMDTDKNMLVGTPDPAGEIMDVEDYGEVLLLSSYIYNHYGGDEFAAYITSASSGSMSTIDTYLQGKGTSFDQVFKEFSIAHYLNDDSVDGGQYHMGYNVPWVYWTTEHKNFPVSGPQDGNPAATGEIDQYGNDFMVFNVGLAPTEVGTMTINFDGEDGKDVNIGLILYGNEATPNDVRWPELDGSNDCTIDLPSFGKGEYFSAVLVIIAMEEAFTYGYTADFLEATPPQTQVITNPMLPQGDDDWYNTPTEIIFDVNEDGSTTYYRFEGETTFTEWDGEGVLIPDGNHTITFYSVDAVGNAEVEQTFNIKVDASAPEITSVTLNPSSPGGDDGWYTDQPTMTIDATDISLGSIQYRINSAWGYQDYTGPFMVPEGDWNITILVSDTAGNKANTYKVVKVDLEEPSLEVKLNPETPDNELNIYSTVPTITFKVSDNISKTVTVLYEWDDGGFQVLESSNLIPPEGIHTLKYYAVDEAGWETDHGVLSVHLDTTAPNIEMVLDPEEPDGENGWYLTAPTISFTSSTDELSELDIFYKWYGDADWTPYEGPFEAVEGQTTITFYAQDPAGNRYQSKEIPLSYDTAEPTVGMTVPEKAEGAEYYDTPPQISLDVPDGVSVFYKVDGGQEEVYSGTITIPDGEHTLTYYVVNVSGKQSEPVTMEFRVDSQPPTVSLEEQDGNVGVGEEITYTATPGESLSGISQISWDFGDNSEIITGTDASVKHTYLNAGTYTVVVSVTNAVGKTGTSTTHVTVLDSVIDGKGDDMDDTGNGKGNGGTDTEDDGSDAGMSFVLPLVIVVILAVVMVVVFMVISKKKQKREETAVEAELRSTPADYDFATASSGGGERSPDHYQPGSPPPPDHPVEQTYGSPAQVRSGTSSPAVTNAPAAQNTVPAARTGPATVSRAPVSVHQQAQPSSPEVHDDHEVAEWRPGGAGSQPVEAPIWEPTPSSTGGDVEISPAGQGTPTEGSSDTYVPTTSASMGYRGAPPQAPGGSWNCPTCGNLNQGSSCLTCGDRKP